MSIVISHLILIAIFGASDDSTKSAGNNVTTVPLERVCVRGDDGRRLEQSVLHFQITEVGFQVFRRVASYRLRAGLAALPGFPEDPNLNCAVGELASDSRTRSELGNDKDALHAYVLTGYALMIARNPGEWGLTDADLTPEMRHNIDFVRRRRRNTDLLLDAG